MKPAAFTHTGYAVRMVITTRFQRGAPVDAAWAFLLDVQKVADCVPGGSITAIVDDHTYDGKIEIRLGAIAVGYKGRVTLENIDESTHTVVIKAQGLESRGRGGASATTTAKLTANGDSTAVEMNTDMSVTGIVAQFGRSGIMQDVAQRLAQRFGNCVDQKLKAAAPAG
jgi:carbon monoxide dehydrogenase subunit G